MSHTVVKLIDIALIPAALMVFGKFMGLLLIARIFDVPVVINELPASIFTIRPGVLPEHLSVISTYSDLIMYIVIALGFSFILVQATQFHETHVKPSLLIRLSNYNLIGLVRSSIDLYHQAVIWLIALWITTGLVLINTLLMKTEAWVFVSCLIASAILTAVLLQDVYKEIELARKNLGKYEAFS